jgi:hypothetical protein
MNTTSQGITLRLTIEQATTIHAALSSACNYSRKQQFYFLDLHESEHVGPVERGEAWHAYRKWERHENETAQAMDDLKQALKAMGEELPFSAFCRFG